MIISVIVPTHNPNGVRLARTLAGLAAQTLPVAQWETILVDNASTTAVAIPTLTPANMRIVRESELGLTAARRRGFTEARAPLCVLVDDDNVLDRHYLSHVARLFSSHPQLGAAGGKVLPEFEVRPPPWAQEFFPLLALRDLGSAPVIATSLRPPGSQQNEYPAHAAPVGAGMALRRDALADWLDPRPHVSPSDRCGAELTSGGDNDIVLHVLKAGWHVGYFPELILVHLIPAGRLAPAYLARLNRGIQKSWMQVLSRHDLNPWSPIPAWTVPLRRAKAWLSHWAWFSPAARIRWQGACGHFEGRVRR